MEEDLFEEEFNQFYIIKYKTRLQAEQCILQDVCFLKKNQEVEINKAYHFCTNLLVIVACQDSKSFLGFGIVSNEPSELMYLTEDSKRVLNIDQLKELQYFSFIKVKWILKGCLNFDLVHLTNSLQENQKLTQCKELQELPALVAKQFYSLFQKDSKPFKKEASINAQPNIIMGMPNNFPHMMPFSWNAPNNMMMNFGSFMGNQGVSQVKNGDMKSYKTKPIDNPETLKDNSRDKRKKIPSSESRRKRSQSSKNSSKLSIKKNSKRSPKRTIKSSPKRNSLNDIRSPTRRSPTRRSSARRSPPKKIQKRSPKQSPRRKENDKKRQDRRKSGLRSRSKIINIKDWISPSDGQDNRSRSRSFSKNHKKQNRKIEKLNKKNGSAKVEQQQKEILFDNDRLSSESVEPKKEHLQRYQSISNLDRLTPQDSICQVVQDVQSLNGIEDGQINEMISLKPKLDKKQQYLSSPIKKQDSLVEEDNSRKKLLPLVRTNTEETPTKSMKIIKQGKVLFSTGSGSIFQNQGNKGVISIQRSNVQKKYINQASVPSLSSRLIVKKQ